MQPAPWLVLSAQLISMHLQNQTPFSNVLQETNITVGLHNALGTQLHNLMCNLLFYAVQARMEAKYLGCLADGMRLRLVMIICL